MALDRQSIEKRDFPIGRRGYDPDAVDAHLGLVADELESLRRSGRAATGLAGVAAEQVRLIVEAAEQSASDIERDADLESRRIRQDARDAAEQLRSDAGGQAREHVSRVTQGAQSMLERLDGMEAELRTTLETLRAGAARLASDLALLQSTVAELRGGVPAGFDTDLPPGIPPEPATRPAGLPSLGSAGLGAPAAAAPDAAVADLVAPDAGAPDAAIDRLAAPDPAAPLADDEPELGLLAAEPAASGAADEEGARLIALNMALNGSPREEVEGYLLDHYDLPDAGGLLDDVYARVG